jgi:hypothetical protein
LKEPALPFEARLVRNENARRLDRSKPPGVINLACGAYRLEHAEHNRADKGERDIRDNNAKPADERTHESH